ncbi:hypothetical protein ACR5KS_05175 [Leucobacter sp. W1153]|uniref:hypothetical protein n=1 Tax=Leucobacter sp. W1153 TaxID=3439064 RepID=UPI003F3FDE41
MVYPRQAQEGVHLLAELRRCDHLFTYLKVGGSKTTSRIECGANAVIKQALRLHCGMTIEHQTRAAEWVLIERAGLLHAANEMDTEAAIRPPQKRRPQFTQSDPGPTLYDTGLSAEERL